MIFRINDPIPGLQFNVVSQINCLLLLLVEWLIDLFKRLEGHWQCFAKMVTVLITA